MFQFKIQLKNISSPTVWRRVSVPENFSFYKFHQVIQAAFGWEDYHLFQFSPRGYASSPVISIPNPEFDHTWRSDIEELNAKKIKLQNIFTAEKQKYTYIYDFGDDWKHEITLEKITDAPARKAELLAGKGTCPPEDCGGPWGYEQLKENLRDPKHPDYRELKEWLGLEEDEEWDADYFDPGSAQEIVKEIA